MAAVTQTEADLRAAARMANPAAQPLHTTRRRSSLRRHGAVRRRGPADHSHLLSAARGMTAAAGASASVGLPWPRGAGLGNSTCWAAQADVAGDGFLASPAASTMPLMIDAHHHLWDLAAREHRWLMGAQPWATDDEPALLRRSFTLADLVPLAAAAGITGTVVIQAAAEAWETPDLLALAAGGGLLAGWRAGRT